jgi:hypothetical protein
MTGWVAVAVCFFIPLVSHQHKSRGVPTAFGSIEGVGSPSLSLPTYLHRSLTSAFANLIVTTGSYLRMEDPSFPFSFVLCFVESFP